MTDQTERERAICDRIARRMGGRFVEREDNPMTDTPEAVALKPCPFCQGAALWRKWNPEQPTAPFGLVVDHTDDCFLSLPGPCQRSVVSSAWNTRPDADIVRQLVEALDLAAGRLATAACATPRPTRADLRAWTVDAIKARDAARTAGYGGQS